jgi:hypothetical protein
MSLGYASHAFTRVITDRDLDIWNSYCDHVFKIVTRPETRAVEELDQALSKMNMAPPYRLYHDSSPQSSDGVLSANLAA